MLYSACFSRLRLLRFDQSSLAMEEVLIQGDTAGAAASPPCPFDAARREPPLPRHAATVLAPAWRRPVGAAAPAPRRLRVCPYVDKNQEATTMEDIAAHREAPRRPIPQGRRLVAMSWLKLLVPHASRIPPWPNPTPMARTPTPTPPSPALVPSSPAIAAVAHPRHPGSKRRCRRPSRRENRGAPRRLRLQSLPPLGSATFDEEGEEHRARQAGGPN